MAEEGEVEELPPINIEEVDAMCGVMSNPAGGSADIEAANQYLEVFRNREDAWLYFSQVIEGDTYILTKSLMIDILINVIQTRQKFLSEEDVESIRQTVAQYTTAYADIEDISPVLLNGIDRAYVALLLQEWPVLQSEMFTVLFATEEVAPQQIINHIKILAILFEEVFNEENEKITSVIRNAFVTNLSNRSQELFEFLISIITSGNEVVIPECFKCFNAIAKYANPDVLKSTNFFETICQGFLGNPEYSTSVLLTISSIFDEDNPREYLMEFVPEIFNAVCESVSSTETDFSMVEPTIINVIAEALTVFINRYPQIVEVESFAEHISFVCTWISQAMEVDDLDTFRTCSEFWNATLNRYLDKKNPMVEGFKQLYNQFLPTAAQLTIQKMPRPPEIIIKNDGGQLIKEDQTETAEADLFRTAKNNIWKITKIDTDSTLDIFLGINTQLQSTFDADVFNSFYWSVGAISGSMQKDKETQFISTILIPMIPMCDSASNENDRAFIASGIMYICAQYPRFISSTIEFFQTVIDKLIQFMNQDVPGIAEMAVNTFKTIGQRAKQTFCTVKGEARPMIFDVIDRIDEMTNNLPPHLKASVYDALSKIANGFKNRYINMREEALQVITNPLNQQLNALASNCCMENVGDTNFVLECHRLISPNIPVLYNGVLHSIFELLLQIYANYSQLLIQIISSGGFPNDVRNVRRIKSTTLQIILSFLRAIPVTEENPGDRQSAVGDLIQPLFEVIIPDYTQTQDEALFWQEGDYEEDFNEGEEHPVYQRKVGYALADTKVPEVIELFTEVVKYMPDVFDAATLMQLFIQIFNATLPLLGKQKNFIANAPFRMPFYTMINAVVSKYMENILEPEFLNVLVSAIEKGENHPGSDICSVSLQAKIQFAVNIPKVEETKVYFEEFFRHSFETLVDATHKSVFDEQVNAIHVLFVQSLEFNTYTKEAYAYIIRNSLQQIELPTLVEAIGSLLESLENFVQFRQVIRDILIENKTYSPTDPEIREKNEEDLRIMAFESMNQQVSEPLPVEEEPGE